MSATATTKKPDDVKTEELSTTDSPKSIEGAPETAKSKDATSTTTAATGGEKTTPTATPPTQPGPSGVAAATGQEEEVKSKTAEKKSEVSQLIISAF